jgi:cell shape-determining protein MreD
MIGWNRRWTLFTIVLIALHYVLHATLGLGVVAPDLLMAAALLGGRRLPAAGAAGLGLLLGLLADAFAVTGFGASGVALALIAAVGSLSRDFFEGESVLFTAGYLLAGAWTASMIAATLGGRLDTSALGSAATSLAAAAYTTVAGLGALSVYRRAAGPRA